MIFKGYFLNRKIQALLRTAKTRSHCYRALDDVRYVLILCEVSDRNVVEACVRTLKAMKKSVHICVYTQKRNDMQIWDYGYLLVEAKKDINIWGFPKKNIREQLNHLSADMLLDLTGDEYPVMRYLMLQHPATFKAGAKYASEKDWYDFSIVMKEGMHDIAFLFNQIINYLRMIRSKNL